MNPNGIGLGLFICKNVVEKCNGQIWVKNSVHISENPLRHGTKFAFTMKIDSGLETENLESESSCDNQNWVFNNSDQPTEPPQRV